MPTISGTAFFILVGSSFGLLLGSAVALWLYVPFGWIVLSSYVVWAVFLDQAPYNGRGRIFLFLRFNWLWQFAKGYFAHTLRQESELDPSQKHLFVAHPHGVIALGTWLVFGGDSIYFLRKNPNLQLSTATVGLNFLLPFWRDLLLALGFVDASYASLKAVLAQNRSVCLLVGGSQEALEAHPNTNRLVLDKRRGFIKLALETGAKVVPVYTFGETNMYTQMANPPGSWLRSIQDALVKSLTIATPILTSGPLPKSTPLLTVVGPALDFPHISAPSPGDIAKYHATYKVALQALFDKHKHDYYTPDELKSADLVIFA
ncbi:hypothetical protein, variant 1 [Aphanomyces invadans]|uniref:Acyltransferase n=1 Tax=Aphanomyces invadans TaxID=157072 RepID=A0A024UI32_9STRA|nr:hypothetical protein, variant 1 [Aphanomyces invadans]ETW05855.1 hypothetical protein, variant 1 [Aphanomyces invadans]|eukprot:XP_008865632.1 hypothetical protein, variant 1 [Aphanomyces invadans]